MFDASDYELVKNYYWSVNSNGYVQTRTFGKLIYMHRLIMNPKDGLVTDHINHDTTDNRRRNLRNISISENGMNHKKCSTNTSGYSGVSFSNKDKVWISTIKVKGVTHRLGCFKNIEEAVKARHEAEERYFGEFAYKGGRKVERYKVKPYQQDAVDRMKNGCILNAGVGTGKSFMGLLYYWTEVCDGVYTDDEYKPMKNPRPLLIITTPKKRDSLEWEKDMLPFLLSPDDDANPYSSDAPVRIDSWQNIKKYTNVVGYFVIFDENCLSSWGTWTKSFLKIAKKNQWILLTATPGDNWSDYIPVFIANGFYKNKTEFKENHIIMNPFTRYPSIKGYFNQGKLMKYRKQITVTVNDSRITIPIHKDIRCDYDKETEKLVLRNRWHPFEDRPLRDATEMAVVMRKIAFGDYSRIDKCKELHEVNPRIIIFYDYDFELDMLVEMCETEGYVYAQWNGHKHDPIPDEARWLYLVQYTAGNAAWNCISTNCMIFFNDNYSYKKMKQAAGRIDRLNTPYHELFYYHLTSSSFIDKRIKKTLLDKSAFNDVREFRRYFI